MKTKARKMIQSLMALGLCLLACPAAMQAEVSRDSVPSNYGGWVNLTEGYTEGKGTDHQKMQVEIEGDVIHLCWCELTPTTDTATASGTAAHPILVRRGRMPSWYSRLSPT